MHDLPLKPFQKEVLSLLSKESHVICIAPTGSGKTRIVIELLKKRHRILMITPLLALERQQAEVFSGLGLRRRKDFEVLSPERLVLRAPQVFRSLRPDFVVIDECHLVWEWGHRFRPAFYRIPELISEVKRSLWLTATLSRSARDFLIARLPQPYVYGRFDFPPNLSIRRLGLRLPERVRWLVWWLTQQSSNGLIFVSSRTTSQKLSHLLQSVDFRVEPYHAGLAHEERLGVEQRLKKGTLQIAVGTNALGLGMDLDSVGWVVVFEPPFDLTSLAQMIGRTARRNRAGAAWVLWHPDDESRLGSLSEDSQKEVFLFLKKSRCIRCGLTSWFAENKCTNCHCHDAFHENIS